MAIKPIQTEADHAAALSRLDVIFDAAPGTAEGDEAQALVAVIEAYEKEHYPINPPSPLEAIRFRREQQG